MIVLEPNGSAAIVQLHAGAQANCVASSDRGAKKYSLPLRSQRASPAFPYTSRWGRGRGTKPIAYTASACALKETVPLFQ